MSNAIYSISFSFDKTSISKNINTIVSAIDAPSWHLHHNNIDKSKQVLLTLFWLRAVNLICTWPFKDKTNHNTNCRLIQVIFHEQLFKINYSFKSVLNICCEDISRYIWKHQLFCYYWTINWIESFKFNRLLIKLFCCWNVK